MAFRPRVISEISCTRFSGPPRAGARPQQLQIVDHDQPEPVLPLQPARAGAQAPRPTAPACRRCKAAPTARRCEAMTNLSKSSRLHLAAPDLVGRDARIARRGCGWRAARPTFRARRSRPRRRPRPPCQVDAAVRRRAPAIGLGGVERDVGGERRLSHRGTAGQDDQVGRVQAAQLLVELGEAGRDADDLAVALEGGLRHRDRAGQRDAERRGAALGLAGSTPARTASLRRARSARSRDRRGRAGTPRLTTSWPTVISSRRR